MLVDEAYYLCAANNRDYSQEILLIVMKNNVVATAEYKDRMDWFFSYIRRMMSGTGTASTSPTTPLTSSTRALRPWRGISSRTSARRRTPPFAPSAAHVWRYSSSPTRTRCERHGLSADELGHLDR